MSEPGLPPGLAGEGHLRLPDEEPGRGPWSAWLAVDVVVRLLDQPFRGTRPVVVGVDGRSGSGKTTTARALLAGLGPDQRGACVATDDVAWHQSRLDWDGLLAEHVLGPARSCRAVCWQPPAWAERDRDGAVEVPAGLDLLLVEGVGATRRALAPLLDAAVWVQADVDVARERGLRRDMELHDRTEEEARTEWEAWMAEEQPHLAADKPWERADLVVAGSDVGLELGPVDLAVALGSPLIPFDREYPVA